MAQTQYIGRRVLRKEDPRLLSGHGQFVDDIHLPNTAHLLYLRSPHAHAKIRRLDITRAESLHGVIEVLTGEDVRSDLGTVPFMAKLPNLRVPPHYPLAVERVRYVGEPVAAVVAESPYIARDALDLIEVEYDPLPAVVDPEKALQKDSPVIYEEWNSNVAGTYNLVSGDVLQAFRRAYKVVKVRLVNQRLAPVAMECRAVQSSYHPGDHMLTLWSTTQIPHILRNYVARSLKVPENLLRVMALDVGGGFGSKLNIYPEEMLTPYLAMRLGRPVKWVETRRENLLATTHGRDQINNVEMALAKDGRILGLRCRTIADIGAYLHLFTAGIPTSTASLATGCYKIPAISFGITEVFTNKMSTDAYRGAGRPEAIYLIERMMDLAARELRMDPAAIRIRNMVKPRDFPYTTATGSVYDSGNYPAILKKALQEAGYQKLRAQQPRWRKQGRLLGVGMSSYVEICGTGPASDRPPGGGWESATVRIETSGKVTVLTGSSPHGQGGETSFAQIVADGLGISVDDVAVLHGDTGAVPAGIGTFGSRTTAVGGSAVYLSAQKLSQKMTAIAARLLETSPANIIWRDGKLALKRSARKFVTFDDVVKAAYRARDLPRGMEPGLEATTYFSPPEYTYPFGAHVCVVEIEPQTGAIKIIRYIAVDDCSRVINPMIVAGQVEGGIAQGIGQALYEEVIYDEAGQLLTGSLMDYVVPKAEQLPAYECLRTETPTKVNPLGVKGVGEAGTIGATPAVVNAVLDALAPYGVRNLDMPLKPEKIWKVIRKKEVRS
ncbi:MAG: xanthine dehydrogenase family protein molybdopterin-binding subunit [Acidobacteria bacterium]|nr:xanthine dehydrogenase family protein molybdopterin-binding subunit [Acidobacteriota bacterium]